MLLKSSTRARADHTTGCVFLPANATSLLGIHTVCVWSAWERSMQSHLSRSRLPALRASPAACTSLPEGSLSRGSLNQRSLLRSLSRICGPSFRLRSPRPSNPDRHGPGRMGVGPSGEEQPHYTVPVSPQCPQEIGLPTLPAFQGTAVSSKRISQSRTETYQS